VPDESHFIAGVYNYCDRWCERCPLTARCRLFADEQKLRAEELATRGDVENAEFWETFDELTEAADWDAEFPEIDAEYAAREEEIDEATDRYPLVQLSHDYAMEVHRWLARHEDGFPSEENRFRAGRDAITPAEALEVISWHHFQINIKLKRAARGLYRADEELDEADDEESWDTGASWDDDDEGQEELALRSMQLEDVHGSAKVALIGIERSIGAWTILREAFPQEDAAIQKHHRQLTLLRRMLDAELPEARSFRRPGFDDAE
jgi:hypothetical protein